MKQKLPPKYFLAGILALSLFSFLFVNLHSALSNRQGLKTPSNNTEVMVEEQDAEDRDVPVPDVTIISRAIELLQHLAISGR